MGRTLVVGDTVLKVSRGHIFFYQTPETANKLNVFFPGMKTMPVEGGMILCAIPHTIDAVRILTNVGKTVDSPILHAYDWPGVCTPFDHQRATSGFLTVNKRAFCLNGMGCVDADTEFLSPRGWVRIGDYQPGTPVAQYNQSTGESSFVSPRYIKLLHDGPMYRFKTTRGVDQLLSPEHRVLYVSETGVQRVISAQEMFDAHPGWRGKFITTFIGGRTGVPEFSEPVLRLLVAVVADGHFPCATHYCVVRLLKQRKVDRLRTLLCNANVKYRERFEAKTGFTVFLFNAPARYKAFEGAFWRCDYQQLQVVVDEARYWDGSERKAGGYAFSSTQKESADFVQYAAAATGRTAYLGENTRVRRGRVETEYVVYVQSGARLPGLKGIGADKLSRQNKWVEPSPDGFKYCFSVPDTFWIARRNGNIFITGNTGKTKSALWAADYLQDNDSVGSILVTCPLSTLGVWAGELFKTLPHRKFEVVYGSRLKRLELLAKPADFYIINHDGLEIIADALKRRPDINHLIIDEVACFRNRRTKKWKVINEILNGNVTRTGWGMTGTPTPNEPTDAYAQMRLIKPENYRGSFASFKDATMFPVNQYRWVTRAGSEHHVNQILKPSIRYALEDCIDLPPTIYSDRKCELSGNQKHHYDRLVKEAITTVNQTQVTAVNAGVLLNKLVQAACGVLYGGNEEILELDFGPRLATMCEIIDECNEKVIVFVPLTGVLDAIYEKICERWSVSIVDGRTPKGRRLETFRNFQDSKDPHILLANAGTMAHGLTLTAASTIIWYAPINSNDIYNQANARIVRPGQRNITNIVRMGATSVEQRMYRALEERTALQDVVLSLAKSA